MFEEINDPESIIALVGTIVTAIVTIVETVRRNKNLKYEELIPKILESLSSQNKKGKSKKKSKK